MIMQIPTRIIVKILSVTLGFLAVLYLAYLVRTELVWLIAAFSLALAFNPLVLKLAHYMPFKREGARRGSAIAAVVIIVIAAVVAFTAIFVPPLISQSQTLVHNLPHYYDQLLSPNTWTGKMIRQYNLLGRIKSSEAQLIQHATEAGGSVVGIVQAIFSSLIALTSVLVFTIFMLNEGPTWRRRVWSVVAPEHREHLERLASDMYRSVTAYVNGKLIMSLLAAVPTVIILEILHVPYAIALGILVGLFDLLPLVGATIGAVVVLAVCFFTSFTAVVVMAIFFLIYQQVENHVIQPLVFAKSVEISSLIVLISILFGARIGGILGALIAIPITASLQILIKDYLVTRAKKQAIPHSKLKKA